MISVGGSRPYMMTDSLETIDRLPLPSATRDNVPLSLVVAVHGNGPPRGSPCNGPARRRPRGTSPSMPLGPPPGGSRRGWITADPSRMLRRCRPRPDRARALSRAAVEQLLTREHISLRERSRPLTCTSNLLPRPPGPRPGRGCHPHRERLRHRQVPLHLAGHEQGLAGRRPDRRDPARRASPARPGRRPGQGRAEDPAIASCTPKTGGPVHSWSPALSHDRRYLALSPRRS